MRGRALLLVVGTSLSLATPSTARVLVRGVVTDANGGTLPGASIYLRGTGLLAVSDARGRFALDGEHTGAATLVATLSGFRAFESTLTLGVEPIELSILLALEGFTESVTVRAETPRPVPQDLYRIGTLDIYRTAGANADPLLATQMLPGVVKADEGAGLFVRGGDVHETRTLVDRAVLDHPYRYESTNGGLFGTVPPFLITGVSLSAGGFPARFGDALSGVLELHGLERPESRSSLVTLGLAAASAQLSLPVGRRAGLRLSGNQSFTGLLFAVNRPEQRFERHPAGTDVNVGGYYESRSLGSLKASFFQASERVGVEVEEEAFRGRLASESDNELASLRWARSLFGRAIVEVTLSQTRYRESLDVGAITLSSRDRGRRARLDATTSWHGTIVRVGAESERRRDALEGTSSRRGGDLAGLSGAREWRLDFPSSRDGGYVELQRSTSRVDVNVGLRTDHYATFGRWVHDPRAALTVRLTGPHRVRLAWGRYHQAPSAGYLDSDWGNPALGVMGARHVVLGYGLGHPEDPLHLRIEAYDKRYAGLPVEDSRVNYTAAGTGSARGFDVFLRGSGGEAWDAWGSYGLVRARRRSTRLADFGRYDTPAEPARPDFEIPHTLQLAVRRALPHAFTVTGSFRLASGKPFTPIVSSLDQGGTLAPIYGELNSERAPRYQRLDVSLSQIRPVGNAAAAVWFVGITNVLGRRNVFGYSYSPDFRTRSPRRSAFGRTVYFGVSFQR